MARGAAEAQHADPARRGSEGPRQKCAPLGFWKWTTSWPWNRFTSSIPGMVLTPSRFSVLCSRLSSVVAALCTAFFFLRARVRVRGLGYHTSAGRAARRLLQHSAAAERVRLRLPCRAQPMNRRDALRRAPCAAQAGRLQVPPVEHRQAGTRPGPCAAAARQ